MAPPSPRYTLLTAARLLDGSGSAAVEQAALLIDGDRVAGLGRAADVHAPGGATVEQRDYGAATILPGQNYSVVATLNNTGQTEARNVVVSETFDGTTPATGSQT